MEVITRLGFSLLGLLIGIMGGDSTLLLDNDAQQIKIEVRTSNNLKHYYSKHVQRLPWWATTKLQIPSTFCNLSWLLKERRTKNSNLSLEKP